MMNLTTPPNARAGLLGPYANIKIIYFCRQNPYLARKSGARSGAISRRAFQLSGIRNSELDAHRGGLDRCLCLVRVANARSALSANQPIDWRISARTAS